MTAGRTNVLPYTIWMPEIDTAHAVTIPSPTTSETVITTPRIPGLEVRIPAGSVIYDHEYQRVQQLSLTEIPVDRPPFPLAQHVIVPLYFTLQPGAGYVRNLEGAGARIIYPNRREAPPGTRFDFWHYDPGPRVGTSTARAPSRPMGGRSCPTRAWSSTSSPAPWWRRAAWRPSSPRS